MAELDKLTKDELAEKIMDLLAVDLESLVRMTKSDLVELHATLSELKAGGELMGRPISELLEEKIGGKSLKDLTLGELMETVREKGPLGFGILPEIRRTVREEVRGFLKKRRERLKSA